MFDILFKVYGPFAIVNEFLVGCLVQFQCGGCFCDIGLYSSGCLAQQSCFRLLFSCWVLYIYRLLLFCVLFSATTSLHENVSGLGS